jgi:uncharacterized protein YdaU (DUF1376 family)
MHYFQFNIGDYAGHTSRLTPLEDLAYRRMLDLYYLNEQPLNGCISDVARELGLSEYESSVKYVLGKFFTETETGFSQKRIDLEIKKYKSNAKNKSKAGKASAKARLAKASSKVTGVEQVLNTTSTDEQLNINHKPLTNNHKTVIKDKDLVEEKPQRSKFKFSDVDLQCAEWVYSLVFKVAPASKKPNFESWANTIRLMRESDGLTHQDISDVFTWANNDSFWSVNILSIAKLRTQFAQLQAKMNGDNNGHKNTSKKLSAYERARKANDEYRQPNEREMGMGTNGGHLGGTVDEGERGAAIESLGDGAFVDY